MNEHIFLKAVYFIYVVHPQVNLVFNHIGFVQAIDGNKLGIVFNNSKVACEVYGTTTAVSTQALRAIRVKVHHFEVCRRVLFYQDEPVCANAVFAVAKIFYQVQVFPVELFFPVVYHYKIVSCSLVLIKLELKHSHFWYSPQYTASVLVNHF